MKRITVLSLFICISLDLVQSKNGTHYKVLDGDGRYHLHWKTPMDKHGDSEISFKVEIEAKGYFGFGLSPNGGMAGSDIVTGWIKDGKVFFQDRHAVDFSLPPVDNQQDYELIDAYENDTFTVFEFRRKLDTCDENDMVIDESTMRVIYAYSLDDPESEDPFYHGVHRGVKSVVLLERSHNLNNMDLDLNSMLYWDVLSPGIDFSAFDTLYWCKIFKAPNVSEKNHIVYFKPMIEEGHEHYIHHIGFYECIGGTPEEYEHLLDYRGHQCWAPTMPPEMAKCQGYVFTFGAGGEDTVFPEHVGWPIYPRPTYFLFEIHYDNPQLTSGIIDHSGYRFYYTPNVRKFDSGLLMIGGPILPRVFIPPLQEKYIVAGHSSHQCAAWAESGIKFFAIFPHAHLITRQIKIRHFRGNQELPPLIHDKNYDFQLQDFRFLIEEADILPGDQITVECTYNSSARNNVTLGGESSRSEMCMGLIMYYPFASRYLSFSAPSYADINEVLNTNITSDEELELALGSYDWTNIDISEVENAMRYSDHETSCYFLKFPEEGVNPTVSYPNDLIPFEPESTCNVNV